MGINIKDDTLYTAAMPAGSGVFGRQTESDAAPTLFARESIYNYLVSALATVASSGSASDLSTGTLPLGRLHANLQDIANINPTTGDLLHYDGANWVAIAAGQLNYVLTSGGPGVVPSWSSTGAGDMLKADNLSGLFNTATARSNLGVAIGSDVQAWDQALDDISALAVTDGNIIVGDGTNWVAESGATARASLGLTIGTHVQAYDATLQSLSALGTVADRIAYTTALDTWAEATLTAFARSILDDADEATFKATVNLEIGTDVQAYDATLASIATLGTAADKMAYTTGIDTWAETPLTAFARTLLDDAAASNARATLGLVIGTDVQAYDATLASLSALGTAADKIAYTTAIDTWAETALTAFGRSLIDDADAATARTTLGVVIGTDVQAYDAGLADIAALAVTDGNIIVGDGLNWVAESGNTARTSLGLGTGDSPTFTAVTVGNAGLTVGTSVPFSDATGVLTLQNVDALDATTEATIEAAIDTLANLTSVQGKTVTLADAGANAIFGWDDAAGAYENLTAAEATAVLNAFTGDSGAGGVKGLVPAPAAGDAAAAKFLKADGTWTSPAGAGDFVGPASSTDNAIVRFDGAGGKTGQNSGVTIDDSNNMAGLASISLPTVPFSGFDSPINIALSLSVAANALTIALKGADGSDPSSTNPVYVPFRSATAATGLPVWRSITSAHSLVISSGSTLGVAAVSTAFRLWIVLFDDGGVFRLGVINCATSSRIYALTEELASSTAEGGAGAADSAGVFYTGSAVTTKGYRILGYATWESGLGTAPGTWNVGPTVTQLYGPGIRKPGEPVGNSNLATNMSSTATTSTSYTGTSTAVSLTLTSAANFARIIASGDCNSGASGQRCVTTLRRDTTQIGAQINARGLGAGGNTGVNPVTHIYLDRPNSTSSISYNVAVKTSDSGLSVSYPDQDSYITAEEIMA